MKYQVVIGRKARRQMDRFDKATRQRILAAAHALGDDPRPPGCLKMKGDPGYRIRLGDYRIVYEIHDRIVTVEVVRVGHRRDVYR